MVRPLPLITIKLIKPGQEVFYNGYPYRVRYTQISRNSLMVYLEGMDTPVSEEFIDVAPTVIDFEKIKKNKGTKDA